ncbi:MAG: hypothetical protein ACK2U0_13160 [Candidatus Promineifilaceae bacterium]|jgi:hypothetical protein
MAPEFPPNIALLDLRFENSRLKGTLKYYEKEEGSIGVRWLIDEAPEGYMAIGGGAAYITADSILERPASKNKRLVPISKDRYQWSEGAIDAKIPPPMLILILPKGYTADELIPKPIGTDMFTEQSGDERLVLFWMNKAKQAAEIIAEWTLKPAVHDLEAEWIKINSRYLSLRATDEKASSSIVETHSVGDQTNLTRLQQNISRAFIIEELKQVCYGLGVDYENIERVSKGSTIIELIGYFDRRDRIDELVAALEKERPKKKWRELFENAGYAP